MKINYTNLTFTELVNKIGSSRFFDLPSMLKEAFTRLANTPSGDSRPYKVYTALLTQSGTDAPVAKVLENSAPINITYIYVANGIFKVSFPYPSDIAYTKLAIILGKLVNEQSGAIYTYDG